MERDHPSAENIIALYHEGAEAWDSVRKGNCIELAWLERYRALLPAKAHILDLGCGGGDPIAGYFVQHGYHVCGVDSSAPLLALCQQRFPDAEWHLADMRRIALRKTFGGILAWDSFFHLTRRDQRHMFSVFHHHSEQETVLMFTSGPDNGEAIGEFMGQPLYHASLDHDEYRQLLADNGFRVLRQVTEDPDCGGRTVWLAQREK
ncbi:class I SAM-dependent methyltransferase [Scandinavium sp.]|uniref:class I SAM-dependent DNA methyltransferase n=1 Tax=Scandinavium sp. TaxID=2830653 RepID=UPI0028988DFA|nr:class I SAM-dependent methyltransferase [Scandinavium sp.]